MMSRYTSTIEQSTVILNAYAKKLDALIQTLKQLKQFMALVIDSTKNKKIVFHKNTCEKSCDCKN